MNLEFIIHILLFVALPAVIGYIFDKFNRPMRMEPLPIKDRWHGRD